MMIARPAALRLQLKTIGVFTCGSKGRTLAVTRWTSRVGLGGQMWARRRCTMGIVSACALGPEHPAARAEGLHGIRLSAHEHAMRLAIEIGKRNPVALFGAVIVRRADGAVSASGLNDSRANPTLHGEIVAIDDYVARHGNRGWGEQILYTTATRQPNSVRCA